MPGRGDGAADHPTSTVSAGEYSPDATSAPRAVSEEGPRTRGGWTPAGTAVARRETSSRRATRRGERTRRQIIDAARRVFERDGYLDIGVPHIIKEAGVAHGTFYTYFESKLEVLRQVCDEAAESNARSVQQHTEDDVELDPVEHLQRMNRRYLRAYQENARLYALIDQLAQVDPVLLDIGVVRRSRHVEHIAALIRGWQDRGVADPAIDAAATAEVLVSTITDTAHWLYAMPSYQPSFTEEQVIESINTVWIRAMNLRRKPRRKWLAAREVSSDR